MFVKEITELNYEEAKAKLANLRMHLRRSKRDLNYTQTGKMGLAEDIRYLLNKFPTLKN
jgi:hypothetical protein